MNKLSTQTPFSLVARSISNKEKGGTLQKTLSLEEPSRTGTSHLEIKVLVEDYDVDVRNIDNGVVDIRNNVVDKCCKQSKT